MTTDAPARRALLKPPFAVILATWLGVAVAALAVITAVGSLDWQDWTVEALFFARQDAPVLSAALAVSLALALVPTAWAARLWSRTGLGGRVGVGVLAAVVVVAGVAGVWAVFFGYSFSLDEFLANFDARIIASGRLVAPVPAPWQPYAPALQPMYMLPLPNDVWVSSYLPVNAAMRALGRLAHAEWLVNPLLSGFSVVAVYAVGRQLWPDRPAPALVAAALLGTSSQLIVMGMTAYAMSGHLAFNLAWLWLFLRGGRLGHAGALVVGFLATGLHQLLFHPLFAAPFVLQLWVRRRWWLAATYTLAYGAIVGFWVEYWPLMQALNGIPSGDESTGGEFLLDRINDAFGDLQWRNLGVMAQCLLRFIAWQNILTAPLAVIGAAMAVRTRGYLRPLALGVLATLLVVFFATPTQTHGWGYRYLQGLMGSVALIAAWGWMRLTERLAEPARTAAAGAMALACAVSLVVLAPLHAWQARGYVQPYAAANAAVQSAKTDVVVVDHDGDVLFDMGTLVRNDPFLAHTPKVMALAYMNEAMLRSICRDHTVLVFDGASATAYGIRVLHWHGDRPIARLRALMQQLGCYHEMRR